MVTGKFFSSTLFGAALGLVVAFSPVTSVSAAPVQTQLSDFQLQQQLNLIRNFVQVHHLVLDKLAVEESAPDRVHAMGSCTVTATVSIPGGTGVTVSATAATCAEAAKMVADGVKEIAASIGA